MNIINYKNEAKVYKVNFRRYKKYMRQKSRLQEITSIKEFFLKKAEYLAKNSPLKSNPDYDREANERILEPIMRL